MSRKRRPRRNSPADEEAIFGDQRPWKNPAAMMAYRMAVLGLLPIVGLVLGLLAIVWGVVGRLRYNADQTIAGKPQSDAAIVAGAIEVACNAAGGALLYSAFG